MLGVTNKMWNEIVNKNDLKNFMDILLGFHDSCIKEFKYISGAFVNEELSMYPINDKRNLKMIIQRQYKNPSTIEMEFIELVKLKIFPVNNNYTCEILGATMLVKNDCIYWCDCDGIRENEIDDYNGTLICSSRLRWRIVNEYIGNDEIYIEKNAIK